MSESAGWPQDSPGILGVVGTLLWAEERRNIRDLTTSAFEHLCSDCYLSQLFAEQKSRQYANGLIQVKKVTRTGPPPIRTVCTWPNTLEPSARPIAAIQTCVGEDGIDHLGMIVQLPGMRFLRSSAMDSAALQREFAGRGLPILSSAMILWPRLGS